MTERTSPSVEERARSRADNYTGMLWHLATFIIINGLFWVLDSSPDGTINWAYWITLFWGVGLAFHIAWYLIEVSRSGRRHERFLSDERRKGDT